MAYAAKILLDSISEAGDRLTTMEVTFPRFVLAEFNTHRVFSRNSASSRAIPVEKQLARIKDDPFVPTYWGRNQPGMQASVTFDDEYSLIDFLRAEWLLARDYAVEQVEKLLHVGLHKQTANRLLEPFMWHTVIVTSTEWSNFFALRANPDAQPEICEIAVMMKNIYAASTPQLVKKGEWHMPLIQPDEAGWAVANPENARKVSAARCARVSYLTHDGKRDVSKDLELYERLTSGGHMSPLEHVATPSYYQPEPSDFGDVFPLQSNWHGNFRGWKQLRKFVPNESDFSKVEKA